MILLQGSEVNFEPSRSKRVLAVTRCQVARGSASSFVNRSRRRPQDGKQTLFVQANSVRETRSEFRAARFTASAADDSLDLKPASLARHSNPRQLKARPQSEKTMLEVCRGERGVLPETIKANFAEGTVRPHSQWACRNGFDSWRGGDVRPTPERVFSRVSEIDLRAPRTQVRKFSR